MDLENRIKYFLQKSSYKPNYLWTPQNYLNGFLVKIPNYRGTMMQDFQKIMSNYCTIGYFKLEQSSVDMPSYRLTELGYQDLILK